jgi:transitional endoplasmic reticulum ATPase
MSIGSEQKAPPGIRLRAAIEEPRHRGLHLATVAADVVRRLGAVERLAAGPVYVRIVDLGTGGAGFARLAASDGAGPSTLAAQGYVLANCGARPGSDVSVELWDPETQAEKAASLTLSLVGGEILGADADDLVRRIRRRLVDSGLTATVGHRFSLPVADGEPLFEIAAAEPSDRPVRCTLQTEVTLLGARSATTGAPAREEAVFAEIGGLDGPIRKIVELVIQPAEQPGLYARLGIRTARGIILYGPPGSGKTLLARSVARRLGARFFAVNGPEIVSKFYGESEQRLRKVFQEAARQQPSVVFLDELDSIAPSRENASGDLEVRLVSQLLTLMDGLEDRGQVVVIGATNRPGAIDPALRRPGRFDHEVEIAPPDGAGRRAVLQVHTRSMPVSADLDLDELAERTAGFVGADLASLCQEAALAAARRALGSATGSELDPETVAAVAVGPEDFADGLRTVQPSAFRELQQPPAGPDWDEIVGLHEAKRALTERIDWPISRRADLERLGIGLSGGGSGGVLVCGPALSGKTALVGALARRLSASLVYLRGVDLLSPWVGTSERLVRDAFLKARQTSPGIVLIDDLEQLVAADLGLARRVLAQVGSELTRINRAVPAFVVVAARNDEPLPAAVLRDPLFSDVVELAPPTADEVLGVLRGRLGRYAAEVRLDEVAARLAGLPIGRVHRVCHEALTAALWDDPRIPAVRARHIDDALARSAARA